jgi:glycosyltransferase involved in cell wall biosynthesis
MLIGIDASRAAVTRRTGTEFYSLRLIEALLGLDTPHCFRLYFNRAPGPELSERFGSSEGSPVEVRALPVPRLWTHVRLGLEVARHPPDVLFVPSHVLPLQTRPRAVVTIHDLGYLHFPEAHPARQRRYLDWSTRHSAGVAHVVIADSFATRRDLNRFYHIDLTKIIVAYPGYDERLAPVTDPSIIAAVKQRFAIHGRYFLHIGTLQPRKNLANLIRAFADLAPDADVQLVLAGKKGWLYDDLFQLVAERGLTGRVLFPGYVDDADKAALLSGAVAYVFPSLYEGFGFPALEAQACDTPLICANSSSLPEVAGAGALLVDPGDATDLAQAMRRVLSDPLIRAGTVARGRRNLARFSWQACAETVMAALEQAAESQ